MKTPLSFPLYLVNNSINAPRESTYDCLEGQSLCADPSHSHKDKIQVLIQTIGDDEA